MRNHSLGILLVSSLKKLDANSNCLQILTKEEICKIYDQLQTIL